MCEKSNNINNDGLIEKETQLLNAYQKIMTQLDNLYNFYEKRYIDNIKKKYEKEYLSIKSMLNESLTVNLMYGFEIFCKILETENGVIPYLCYKKPMIITSQSGYRWFLIIGTNINLVEKSSEEDYFADYNIIDHLQKLKTYVNSISHNAKEIIVVFHKMPQQKLCEEITNLGIVVKSIDDFPLATQRDKYGTAILDITTLIFLTSEMTNNNDKYDTEKKSIENELCKYKKIIVCNSIWNKFCDILNMYGNQNEKNRFIELQQKITIVNDIMDASFDYPIEKTKELYQNFFGTGQSYKATYFTANKLFISELQKMLFDCYFLHTSASIIQKK